MFRIVLDIVILRNFLEQISAGLHPFSFHDLVDNIYIYIYIYINAYTYICIKSAGLPRIMIDAVAGQRFSGKAGIWKEDALRS